MDPAAHREHARAFGERIAVAGATGDLAATVPSCPEWNLDALLFHTGGFCRFARSSLEQADSVERGGLPHLDYSDYAPGENVVWHRQEHERLMAVLDASDPSEAGWSWGQDQHKAFWFRRAAHELAVHCWDAENTVGNAPSIDPELAADGVDEALMEFGRTPTGLSNDGFAKKLDNPGVSMHLHATDVAEHPGEWMVTADIDEFAVTHEHGKGDVGARGAASDLLLFLWGRVGLDQLEVFGDRALLERWTERCTL